MAFPSWPATVPFRPVRWTVVEPYRANLETEMQAGNVRMRRQSTLQVAQIEQTIRMTIPQFDVAKTFLDVTCANGSSQFLIRIWTGRGWPEKRVQIRNGGRYTFARVGANMDLTMSLDVYGGLDGH